ncbi:MAG TPA: D-alanyl-D-alanine carboxypeptidase family protein [Actinomycetota bacterium]|nr:D-alanyl-D-alanine carboxypeptidase family protein [Actinomycetota bacterium]
MAAVLAGPSAVAQEAPPPTPVPPSGSPSPYPTALATPSPSRKPPEVSASSVALADLESGQVLYQREATAQRPMASITKVMTALLVLEAVPPDDVVTAGPVATQQTGALLGLQLGERRTVRDLLLALMLQSANDAAVALAEHVAGSVPAFVDRMNERARQLGLSDTHFTSPNGLDDRGYSSARDLAAIAVEAFRNPTFGEVVATKFATIPAPKGEPPRRVQNRNALLWLYPGAMGVKTGFTSAAGFCLVAAAERDGLRLVSVILGAPREAFTDAATILDHGFETYERRTIIDEGQEFDPLQVGGRAVPVAADVPVEVLVRRGAELELTVRPEPDLTLPLAEGERVGTVLVRSPSATLGESPLVVQEHVRRAPPPRDPWWERAWDAVARFFQGLVEALFG